MARLSIFDLDHTLIRVNASFHFGLYLYQQRFLSLTSAIKSLLHYGRHRLMGMSIEHLHLKIFENIFRGQRLARIKEHAMRFIQIQLPELLYLPAVQRLRAAQAEGETVVILSSSPDFLVKLVAKALEVENWEATRYSCDRQGNLLGVSSVLEGQQKAIRLQHWAKEIGVAQEDITVYTDSHLDLPILKAVGKGKVVAVRPDRKLLHICRAHAWEIL